jgi:hypothetical protein
MQPDKTPTVRQERESEAPLPDCVQHFESTSRYVQWIGPRKPLWRAGWWDEARLLKAIFGAASMPPGINRRHESRMRRCGHPRNQEPQDHSRVCDVPRDGRPELVGPAVPGSITLEHRRDGMLSHLGGGSSPCIGRTYSTVRCLHRDVQGEIIL